MSSHLKYTPVVPHLCSVQRVLTPHSLKFFKPCGYGATGVHRNYLSEPGAWSGSWLERQSVSGLRATIGEAPAKDVDLATAFGYAARGLCANATECEVTVADAMRLYVSENGIGRIARDGGWEDFAAWIAKRLPLRSAPGDELLLLESPQLPPPPQLGFAPAMQPLAVSPYSQQPLVPTTARKPVLATPVAYAAAVPIVGPPSVPYDSCELTDGNWQALVWSKGQLDGPGP